MPLNCAFNFKSPLNFCLHSVVFPQFFPAFSFFSCLFLPTFFLTFFSTFFPTFFPTFFSTFFSTSFRLFVEGCWPQSSYCYGFGEDCGLLSLLKQNIFLFSGMPKWPALMCCSFNSDIRFENVFLWWCATCKLHSYIARIPRWMWWPNWKLFSSWAGVYRDFIVSCIQSWKRILKAKGLGRRRHANNLREVVQALEEELRGSGSNIRYKHMTQRLDKDHWLVVGKETMWELLKILDPEGLS